VAIQLGGSDPEALARCATMAAGAGYDEVNLNVGCPSDRVRNGRFGACLMAEPGLVARCMEAMGRASPLPITLKTRIGIDRDESAERLHTLVRAVREAGCQTVIVHARNAWLDGLSPKENREIPPLRYAVVHELKSMFPDLRVVLNGGLQSLESCLTHLDRLDGVMLGREAYYNPWLLARVDPLLFGLPAPVPGRDEVIQAMTEYAARECAGGTPLAAITRHLLALFQGQPGSRAWRRTLSEEAHRPGAGPELLRRALEAMQAAAPAGAAVA
jgi:tRNA-dihydrouridine synthase A